jgi:hypothetical protein
MPRELRLFLAAFFVLGCASCVDLPLRSFWTQSEPQSDGLGSAWAQSDEALSSGLRVKALNTGKDLYLTMSTDTPSVQAQLSGRYGQALTLWFGTRPEGHGLCITFTPVPEGHQSVSWEGKVSDAADPSVTLQGPANEGLPRIWEPRSEGIEFSSHRSAGILTYVLKLPLHPETVGGFALGLEPGDRLLVSVDASELDSADLPIETPVAVTQDPGVAGLNNPALMPGANPAMGGGGGGGRRHGGGGAARRPELRPDQPFWYQFELNLSKTPLAHP